MKAAIRAIGFFLVSSAATCFPMLLARLLWAPGASAGAEYMFWIASGVNVAGLLLLGWRWFPCILLNGLPAHFLVHVPLPVALFGSAANTAEALIAAWLLRGLGKFEGRFDCARVVGALLAAAIVGPLPGALLGPALMIRTGMYPASEYGTVASGWLFGNGGAILLLTPILVAAWRRDWPPRRKPELLAWAAGALLVGVFTFDTVLRGGGANFVFLLFPLVIFAGVRLGPTGAAAALSLVLLSVYASLAQNAASLPLAETPRKVWFVQAFSWVLAATGLMISALVAERRRAEQRALEEQARRLEASLSEERARLDALRYQINPHFLFNALNSVRAEVPLGSVPRDMLTALAEYLRTTLARPETDTVPLREEIAAAQNYLAIERQRFGERLRVEVAVNPAAESVPVPVFLLQPLVENAIRHGLEPSKAPCEIRIRAERRAGALRLTVANTGAWRSAAGGNGLALANIRRRLELLYAGRASLDVRAEDGIVSIEIEISDP